MVLLRGIGTRFLHLFAVLFAVGFFVFLLLDFLPGDPAEVIASAGTNPSPEAVEELRTALGLDRPLHERYFDWLSEALRGDLGVSYRTGQEITSMIWTRLPVTFQLVVMAEVFALAVAIPAAVVSAQRRGSRVDKSVTFLTFGLQSTPNFIVAIVLILVFAVNFGVLPATGYSPLADGVAANLRTVAIPVVALGASLIPVYTRLLRNDMIRVLQEDYILMARGMGLTRQTILLRYALKPSMPTLLTVVGINIGTLIGGSIIVELICGIPGLGTLLFSGITNRDYLLVQGVVLFIAAAYVVANAVVDLVYTLLDPRVEI